MWSVSTCSSWGSEDCCPINSGYGAWLLVTLHLEQIFSSSGVLCPGIKYMHLLETPRVSAQGQQFCCLCPHLLTVVTIPWLARRGQITLKHQSVSLYLYIKKKKVYIKIMPVFWQLINLVLLCYWKIISGHFHDRKKTHLIDLLFSGWTACLLFSWQFSFLPTALGAPL